MALKTCCSRMRRAISCVYCPPKSSTTTPPSSDFGFTLPSFMRASLVMVLLSDDEIQKLVRNEDYLDDVLTVQVDGDAGVGNSQFDEVVLAGTDRDGQFATQFAIHLDWDFDLIFPSQAGVGRRPTYLPRAVGMAEHLPHLLG